MHEITNLGRSAHGLALDFDPTGHRYEHVVQLFLGGFAGENLPDQWRRPKHYPGLLVQIDYAPVVPSRGQQGEAFE